MQRNGKAVTSPQVTKGPPRTRGGQPTQDTADVATDVSSPHSRGSAVGVPAVTAGVAVLPALAGVSRTVPDARLPDRRPPRTRGGQPPATTSGSPRRTSSPHSRGSAGRCLMLASLIAVLPALAGVSRLRRLRGVRGGRPPRTRGGQPVADSQPWQGGLSSPHSRGSAGRRCTARPRARVLPALAGVSRVARAPPAVTGRPPRTRGGQPPLGLFTASPDGSSPHSRGSAADHGLGRHPVRVFPALAGVSRVCGSNSGPAARSTAAEQGIPPHTDSSSRTTTSPEPPGTASPERPGAGSTGS